MTTPIILPKHTLNDGRSIPAIGLGTGGLRGDDGVAAMVSALDTGYRLLDTALNYGNEREVGEAVRSSSVPRDEILVTTKVPGRHHGFDETLASFEESRTNLGLDHVDLYLIHWPLPRIDKYVDTWRAMIRLRDEGAVSSIGVCNFTGDYLSRLIDETGVVPAVNQIELHPRFPQSAQRAINTRLGIITESWSPLFARNVFVDDAVVGEVASAHNVTATQVVLRWHFQLGAVAIPKSANAQRQRENIDIFGFELSSTEMQRISSLESGRLGDGVPETHEEF